jgi:RND superfamily putative drug exporter
MRTLGAVCYRHRWAVVVIWVVVLGGVLIAGRATGGRFANNFTMPRSESMIALSVLRASFPEASGDVDQVVFHVRRGRVTDPDVRRRVTQLAERIVALPGVTSVRDPFTGNGGGISTDGRTAFVAVQWSKTAANVPRRSLNRMLDLVAAYRSPTVQVEATGQAIEEAQRVGPGRSETWGVLSAIVVLLLAFGSVVAMGLPILTALVAIGTGLGGILLLTQVTDLATAAPQLAGMIGLGVGIDYALFIVSRFRSGLRAGRSVEESVVTAVDSSGRAVLFAGITVVLSMLGMLLLRIAFIRGMALAASLTVLLTMAASLTLLPALLAITGRRIDRLRVPFRHPERIGEGSRGWLRWSSIVQRRPIVAAAVATVILLVLAAPMLSLRLGSSDAGSDPTSTTTRRAYDLLAEGFGPGFNATLQVVVRLPHGGGPAVVDAIRRAVAATPDVARVLPPRTNAAGDVAVLTVYPDTSPQSEATVRLVHQLRDTVGRIAAGVSGVRAYVGGLTAVFIDIGALLSRRLPLFIGVVVLLSVLLLTAVFRSIVVPIKAAVMNLLAIAASFGVVTAVFQWGWGSGVLGVDRTGPIESFLPVMLFAILFGLSMDYEVFLLSRMHEEWVRTGDNPAAVREGIASTGAVITAAAAIMVVVFCSFLLLGQRVIAEFGLGLAVAVFLDALLIRMLLVPALMQLLGGRNWYLPRWLRWLPVLHLDSTEVDELGKPVGEQPPVVIAS